MSLYSDTFRLGVQLRLGAWHHTHIRTISLLALMSVQRTESETTQWGTAN